jgi:hypothetical protein
MRQDACLVTHSLQLPVPRREPQGETSAFHDADRRHLVANTPAATLDEEV